MFLLFLIDCYCPAMVVYLPLIIASEGVHVGVKQHHDEGVHQVEQQPHVHHLHVGGLRQVVAHVDEHRREHQH